MLTPGQAMQQAADTAEYYALRAKKAYTTLFDDADMMDVDAAATFMAAFMRAAAQDFDSWTSHTKPFLVKGSEDADI